MPGLNRHRRGSSPINRSRERKKSLKPLTPNRQVSPKHPEVIFEFLGTRIADSAPKLFKKPKIVVHRPHEEGAIYKYRRLDGKPVTDADLDGCWNCAHCNPERAATVDNRKMV